IECGELNEANVETRLFAARDEARLGTLFLADVDLLPPSAQPKLLRILQDPATGSEGARILAATSRDLSAEVAAGRFRQDLFYRLGVVQLHIPSLRERQDDILPLARHFLKRFVRQFRKSITGFSERALGVLTGYEWPGNVRQLEHCIERAVTVTRGREIEPRDLPRELMTRTSGDDTPPVIPGSSMHELERWAILKTLEHVGGSTSKAAKILGISPRKIQYRIQEYRGASSSSSSDD
ncbi:MAG TPA: sigma 54-interacting transcriptional regulator, partial [Nannocystis sp.]